MDTQHGAPDKADSGLKPAVAYARVSTESQAADDKTSLSEQLLAIRKYAERHGYAIIDEIAEDISGRKQDTEGLEKIRDLAETGKIAAVLVHKWNRMARTVARFESLILEMKLAGVDIVSLDGQSNATATGRMFNQMMAVFGEFQRDDLVETMQQGKRGLARAGKIMPSRFPPYGYEYDRDKRTYRVDEDRMEAVRTGRRRGVGRSRRRRSVWHLLVQHPARRDHPERQADQDPATSRGLDSGADPRRRVTP